MSTKLRLDLENATRKGFDEIIKDLERVGASGLGTEKALQALNQELESRSAAKAAAQIQALADEYDGTAAAARKAAVAADEEADAVKRAASVAEGAAQAKAAAIRAVQRAEQEAKAKDKGGFAAGLSNAVSGAAEIVEKLKQVGEYARMAYSAISTLAETSPKFAALKEQIDGVATAAKEAGEEFAASEWGGAAVESVTNYIGEMGKGVKALPGLWQDLRIIAQDTFATINEGLGIGSSHNQRAIMEIAKENDARRERLALAQQQKLVDQSAANAQMVLANIKKINDQEEESRAIARLESSEAVQRRIKDEEQLMEAKQKAGKFDKDEKEAAERRLRQLYSRERQLQDQRERRLKQFAEDQKKREEEQTRERIEQARKAEQEATEFAITEERKRHEMRLQFQQDLLRQKQAAEMKAAQDAAAKWQSLIEKFTSVMQAGTAYGGGAGGAAGGPKFTQGGGQQLGPGQPGVQQPGQQPNKPPLHIGNLRDRIKDDKRLVAEQVIKTRQLAALRKKGLTEIPIVKPKQLLNLQNKALKKAKLLDKDGEVKEGKDKEADRIRREVAEQASAERVKKGKEAEAEKVKKAVARDTRQDIRQGKVGHEEGEKAVSDLADQTVKMLEDKGGLAKATIETMKKLIGEANKQSELAGAMQDELDLLNQTLNAMQGRNSNAARRAQNAGTRQ